MSREKSTIRSLTSRLQLTILFIVMLVFSLTALGNFVLTSRTAQKQLEAKADEHLANLSHSLELPLWTLDHTLVQAIAQAYLQNDLIVAIRITEADGSMEIFSQEKSFKSTPVVRSRLIEYENQVLGKVSLTLRSSSVKQQLKDLLSYSLASAAMTALVLSLLIGYLLRRLLKQPLLNIQEGFKRLAEGDYTAPLEVDEVELQPIASAFHQMSTQVNAREQELQRLADASWEAILIHDHGILLHANELFYQLFGFEKGDLVGTSCLERIIAHEELDAVLQHIEQGDLAPYETRGQNSFGESFPIEVRSRLLTQNDKTLTMSAIRDLRERKHLEELMIQSEKMISVGGLAAGMAHEINNPLAGILQNIQVVNNRLNPELEKNITAAEDAGTDIQTINYYMEHRGLVGMFENIRQSGLRAARIVENILSFSRKSASSMLPIDIQNLINETLILAESDYDLKKKFDFRKIEIIQQIAPNLPALPCDASQIQQVLLNLLKNGAHAMNQAGTENPLFVIRAKRDGGKLVLDVEDNGPGMDDEVSRRIFEPFFTTKKVGEGTGLGLSVSYFIITETHKGEMKVQSSPQGTRFTVTLPLHQTEA